MKEKTVVCWGKWNYLSKKEKNLRERESVIWSPNFEGQ